MAEIVEEHNFNRKVSGGGDSNSSNSNPLENAIEILVRTIGPARPSRLLVPSPIKLNNGDSLTVAVKPKPPAEHLRDGFDDDEDDLKFRLPESSSWLKKKVYTFLREKLKFPEILLMVIFSLSLKAWAAILIWFIMAPVAHSWDLGPLYILGTGFCIILLNLGHRQSGEMSAYSIFNEGFRELPGTLNADRLDQDVRLGQF